LTRAAIEKPTFMAAPPDGPSAGERTFALEEIRATTISGTRGNVVGTPTFVDGRADLFGDTFLARYVAATSGIGDQLPYLLDHYRRVDIRERRLWIGMTQQRLARIIGVAFQQTHKYERGISRVSAGRLFVIATALSTPIEYFLIPKLCGGLDDIRAAEPRRDGARSSTPTGSASMLTATRSFSAAVHPGRQKGIGERG
jgi:transcriptional regulator with XRE-family HTH domain